MGHQLGLTDVVVRPVTDPDCDLIKIGGYIVGRLGFLAHLSTCPYQVPIALYLCRIRYRYDTDDRYLSRDLASGLEAVEAKLLRDRRDGKMVPR